MRLSMLFGGILPLPANLPIRINLVPGAGGGNNNGANTININCNLNSVHTACGRSLLLSWAKYL